jgi:signal transduction histidine kinase
LNRELVTLQEVIDSAIEISRPHIEKAKLVLTVNLPDEPVSLLADRVRLTQVFSNLLNNAAKYTESGGRVSLTAERRVPSESASDDEKIAVRVRDSGVGIPPVLLPKIFELFTQVNHTLNRSQGGLGVGLALVRRLVELHDGTVSAHSEGPGKGAEFTVRLPIA